MTTAHCRVEAGGAAWSRLLRSPPRKIVSTALRIESQNKTDEEIRRSWGEGFGEIVSYQWRCFTCPGRIPDLASNARRR